MKIERAILSVYNKKGIIEFAEQLKKQGVEILASGGTAKLLKEHSIDVNEVSQYTGAPEIMNGRVKTLHPKIAGGILALRDNISHISEAKKYDIKFIDLVVVNLYPFQETISKPNASLEEAIENIDIGGPTLIRSAAKNYKFVTVVVDIADYNKVISEIQKYKAPSEELRKELAVKAFRYTSLYDSAITNYLSNMKIETFPEILNLTYTKLHDLRYGENPHQKAAFYKSPAPSPSTLANAKIVSEGKELSYNNILDLDSAFQLVMEFKKPTAVIVKHNTPCGVGSDSTISDAFSKAIEGDPISAYGGILALNTRLDTLLAERIIKQNNFFECIISPKIEKESIALLMNKSGWGKKLRLVEICPQEDKTQYLSYRSVSGGLLAETPDNTIFNDIKTIAIEPTPTQKADLIFAWKVAKHTKSNAIVLAKNEETIGIGAGQMSRVDATKIAIMKAGEKVKGSVLASDGFFPFKDAVEIAVNSGVVAIIQPGGSIRDKEIIDFIKIKNIPMLITNMRHFRH